MGLDIDDDGLTPEQRDKARRAAEAQERMDRMRADYDARWAELESGAKTDADKAKELLAQSAFMCAQRVLHSVIHSPNEKLATDTARWVLEKVAYAEKKDSDEVADMMATFFKKAAPLPAGDSSIDGGDPE